MTPAPARPFARAVFFPLAMLGVLVLAAAAVIVVISAMGAARRDVAALARDVPRRTAMMRQRAAEARRDGRRHRVDQRWVAYEFISPALRRAVLIAEDDAFFSHDGLDWNEIRASMERNVSARRIVRGGSTITQQLARNLYLGNARTPVRKLEEILIARRMERTLSKRRIFELYLNLIEWGDGVYGAEAAARRHFGVSATQLDARQAALLAAVIINPRRFDPAKPPRRIEKRMRMILGRMVRRGYIDRDEYLVAIGRKPEPKGFLEWFFGAPAPVPEPPPAEDSTGADAEIEGDEPFPDTVPEPDTLPASPDSVPS